MQVKLEKDAIDGFVIEAIEEKLGFRFGALMSEGFSTNRIELLELSNDPEDTKRALEKKLSPHGDDVIERVHFIVKKKFFSGKADEVICKGNAVPPGRAASPFFYDLGIEGRVEGALQQRLMAMVVEKVEVDDHVWSVGIYTGVDDEMRDRGNGRYRELSDLFAEGAP